MNVRLVAYRKATSTASSTTAYNLDLQEAPNVSLNYQFSEVKEPETRKGSYSQTFKLPFTEKNNQFFQEWYKVNLDTLVFSTRTKFEAVLYVGTVPQFEGFLQLKSVYKKAEMYEVVLMSNSASLFSTIGEQRLKDAFKKDDGSYDPSFNHVYNETNLAASWGSTLQNTTGVSLYDSTVGVSKIVYPIAVTREKFYYSNEKRYLNLDQTEASALVTAAGGMVAMAWDKAVSISQFRPAIQILTLFKRIMAMAGFKYTSTFLDSAYFGKIFMTTATHTELSTVPTLNTTAAPSGMMRVKNDAIWGVLTAEVPPQAGGYQTMSQVVVPANIVAPYADCAFFTDSDSIWNTTYNYFTRNDTSMGTLYVSHRVVTNNVIGNNPGLAVKLTISLVEWDVATNSSTGNVFTETEYTVNVVYDGSSGTYDFSGVASYNLTLTDMPPGSSAQVVIDCGYVREHDSSASAAVFVLGGSVSLGDCGTSYSILTLEWAGCADNIYGATVDFPSCIDPEITQKAFLKDIIQRFNLVVLTDPDDATNLIIEPYTDFIASGVLKNWTDKLDLSKEIVVKDTTELQKKTIHLSDQEDVDLYNKSIKERYPDVNVFGHLKIDEFNNEFATGELKNESIFAPFINGQVFMNEDEQAGTLLSNMAVQYEFTYENVSPTLTENKTTKTKPKLFWYNGAATNVLNSVGDQVNYYLHRASAVAIQAFTFNTYPVCTPFDIVPGDGSNPANEYTLTPSNKSLYWNATPPLVGNLKVFNYTGNVGNWFNNTLYGFYWKSYLDDIYSSEARIMECYLNLNEVDIFNFSFLDEIFIKDTYWRILNISNYQVGAKASTKVTLIKSLDTFANCEGCDYVIGTVGDSNIFAGYYLWCPEDDPSCTPFYTEATDYLGLFTTPECCTCNGGDVEWNAVEQASNGLYPCVALSGSLPIQLKSNFGSTALLNQGQIKSVISGKIGSSNRPFITGTDNDKYGQKILNYYGDDIVIKYKSNALNRPRYSGESHRITLSGYTEGNTRGYAYPQGDPNSNPLKLPSGINAILRVKGIITVVGGSSSTYTLGTTEGLSYYTAFTITDAPSQLGTAGGESEFTLKESEPISTSMYIDIDSLGLLRFGLDDNQTDTKRIWNLTVDIDINRIRNMDLGFDENWALFQNGSKIQFQNGDYLIWN